MDTTTLRQYVALERRRRELEDELKSVKKQREQLEEQLLPEFEDAGVQNMRVDGMTVYLRRELWANHNGDKPALIEAMKRAGLEDMVSETFNTNTLSAWVRELDGLEEPLPDELEPHIKVSERFSLRTQK